MRVGLPTALLALGLALVAVAVGLFVRSLGGSIDALADIVGAMLLVSASGLAFSGALLAARRPSRGLLAVAVPGVFAAAFVLFMLFSSNVRSGNLRFAVVLGLAFAWVLLALGAAAGRLARRQDRL